MLKIIYIVAFSLFLSACDDADKTEKVANDNKITDHVWKQQTDMIDKAKNVEQLLNDAAIQQQKTIDQQVNQ